ncbi:MAG: hypothetical protein ACPGJE_04820, partial [Wenzhouxiangellaceae bacterium]
MQMLRLRLSCARNTLEKLVPTVALGAVLWGLSTSVAIANPPAPEPVRAAILEWMEAHDVPGVAIAYLSEGEITWLDGFGIASEGREVTADTLFNV